MSTFDTMVRHAVPDLLPGTLDLLILRTLQTDSLHGWAISERIQQISQDVLQINQGSLYPALHRLEQRGAVTAAWGPGSGGPRRRYYALTEAGRGQLAEARREWERFVADVEAVASGPASAEGRNG